MVNFACDNHFTVQHRDGKAPWCNNCGRTKDGHIPRSRFETENEVPENKEELHYDENTLRKVYEGLLAAGIFGQQAVDAVSEMQNKGILFRENKPKKRGRPRLVPAEALTAPEVIEVTEKNGDAWSPLNGATGV